MQQLSEFWTVVRTTHPLLALGAKLFLAILLLYCVYKIGQHYIKAAFAKTNKATEPEAEKAENTRQKTILTVWRFLFYLVATIVIFVLLNSQNITFAALKEGLVPVLISKLIQVGVILILAYLGLRLGTLAIKTMFNQQRKLGQKAKDLPFFKGKAKLKDSKLLTLETISLSILRYCIYFITALSILPIFNISITTILTGAGVVGLAIGIGAQNLVRDIVTGAFIIMEDQFDVGDYVEIAGIDGIIEGIGLRTTRVKDFSGVIHYVPNGEVSVVSNHSRNYRRALVDIGVAYEEDIAKVEAVLNDICSELQKSLTQVKLGPTVLGVQALGESDVTFRIIAHTLPMEQWGVERAIRKAVKNRFDELGIEIPYPKRVVIKQQEG